MRLATHLKETKPVFFAVEFSITSNNDRKAPSMTHNMDYGIYNYHIVIVKQMINRPTSTMINLIETLLSFSQIHMQVKKRMTNRNNQLKRRT